MSEFARPSMDFKSDPMEIVSHALRRTFGGIIMHRRLGPILLVAALFAIVPHNEVHAQEPIRPDCLAYVAPTARLKFNDETHRRWYHRAWAGVCEGLSFFSCTSGKPHWNDAIGQILKEGSPERKVELLGKSCKLAHLIGYEWAKDNSIRCIHTSDGDKFLAIWKTKADVFERLNRIEALAKSMLRCRS